ncbi:hypothetical protein [Streptomyces silvensis]|uniref:hypothetical protein n=1 Tax=Streptomyces silvensis TaxID=1765722 RepID=UPI00099E75CD|nr:hypothetical protein [Streptomyces silvensis]
MRTRTMPPGSPLTGVAVSVVVALAAVAGCGSGQQGTGSDTDALADRARRVAEAWDGATAAPAAVPSIGSAADVPGHPLHRLVRAAPDGRSVTVVALHGACDAGASVGSLETGGSVVLWSSVKGREETGDCTKQVRTQRMTVKLDRPVGDRSLLDARTGRPIPQSLSGAVENAVEEGLRTP